MPELLLGLVIFVVCLAATALLLFRIWHRPAKLPPRLLLPDHPRYPGALPSLERERANFNFPSFAGYRHRPFDWSIDS